MTPRWSWDPAPPPEAEGHDRPRRSAPNVTELDDVRVEVDGVELRARDVVLDATSEEYGLPAWPCEDPADGAPLLRVDAPNSEPVATRHREVNRAALLLGAASGAVLLAAALGRILG